MRRVLHRYERKPDRLKFKKPCLDCGALSYGNRCERHEATHKAKRNERYNSIYRKEKKKILYGGNYKKRRQEALGATSVCYLCNKPLEQGQAIDIDHLEAGNPKSFLLPTHARCNRSRGNKSK